MKDYYKIIGADIHASQRDIKRAYHRTAHLCHPDTQVGYNEHLVEQFKEVTEANNVLSNIETRSAYNIEYASEYMEPLYTKQELGYLIDVVVISPDYTGTGQSHSPLIEGRYEKTVLNNKIVISPKLSR